MSYSDLPFESLTSISPLDGRYRQLTEPLARYVSEAALIKARVRVEIEWVLYLNQLGQVSNDPILDAPTINRCRQIWRNLSIEDAREVREIEKTTNHDVKAVEYFVRKKIGALAIPLNIEMVHFGCTSEDISNLAYGLILHDLRNELLCPTIQDLIVRIVDFARPIVDVSMLARTHGQAASPTTVGKELANIASRMDGWCGQIEQVVLRGKMNGAVGNFNAHVAACPNADWPNIGSTFVRMLGLEPNECTTQIEPHDYIAQLLNATRGLNTALLDFVRDIWGYISIGYFKQRQIDSEVGSSTMPHKVNPIDFENAEGNLGIANSILAHLSEKLLISRWQRDLSDSTALRNIGVAMGHSILAYNATIKGIDKLEVDSQKTASDLDQSWEVLTEAVQTAMRLAGIEDSYDKVKALTRGEHFDQTAYIDLLSKLDLPVHVRESLAQLSPSKYVGLAADLATKTLDQIATSRKTREDS